MDAHVEREARAEDVVTQQPVFARLPQSSSEVLHRDRVLLPHVDEALVGPDGVGSDDEPLEHPVRVALEQAPVHVGAGVTLVGVHDHVLDIVGCVPGGLPLGARGETATSAAPELGLLDLVQHLLRRHLQERLDQRRIASVGDVAVDVVGVDEAVETEHHRRLRRVERDVVLS